MSRHFGRQFSLQRLNCIVGVRTGQVPKNARCTVEKLTRTFERHNRVLECRRFGILCDRFDLRQMCGQGRRKSRVKIMIRDGRELRQAKWAVPMRNGRIDFSGFGL